MVTHPYLQYIENEIQQDTYPYLLINVLHIEKFSVKNIVSELSSLHQSSNYAKQEECPF